MPVGADADGSPQHPYLRSGTQGFFEASMTSGDHSDEEGEQIQVRHAQGCFTLPTSQAPTPPNRLLHSVFLAQVAFAPLFLP